MTARLACVNTEISCNQRQYEGVLFHGMKHPPPNTDKITSVAWLTMITLVESVHARDMKFNMLSLVRAVYEMRQAEKGDIVRKRERNGCNVVSYHIRSHYMSHNHFMSCSSISYQR